jgi:hypothetical protein
MESNIKVAWVHRVLSLFYLFCAVVLVVIVAVIGRGQRFGALLYLVALLPAAMFCLHHVIARGAQARRPWARIASIVVACFMLLGFPIGTLIGVYLLINNWREPVAPSHGSLA